MAFRFRHGWHDDPLLFFWRDLRGAWTAKIQRTGNKRQEDKLQKKYCEREYIKILQFFFFFSSSPLLLEIG